MIEPNESIFRVAHLLQYNMEPELNALGQVSRIVQFKQKMLLLDLQSRRFLLERCIDYIQVQSADEHPERDTLLTWFDKCLTLSEFDIQNEMRKAELRSPEFWNVIFECYQSHILHNIITYGGFLH